MFLPLRRLAGGISAPLRRSLRTAASRPPWAMVCKKPQLNASGPPPPGRQRASLDLNEAPCVSQLSVPADLAYPEAAGSVRAASCDGLLLLDFADTRQFPPAVRKLCHKSLLHEMAVSGDGAHLDVARFVCNPLSGQLLRLPAPDDTDAAKMGAPFGLLTQSPEGSHGPPDRFVVAQLGRGEGDSSSRVLRRYLSDTGEWDERELLAPPAWRAMQIDTDHEVLALGDRLWWVDLSLGVCSVDPFSDRPEHRFVELPDCSALPAAETGGLALAESPMLSRYRRLGVSEGKLRYVQLWNIHQPFQIGSFSLDAQTCSWTLDHAIKIAETSPDHIFNAPWIAAIDPFKANVLYLQHGGHVVALDMGKGEEIWRSPLPDTIARQMNRRSRLFLPCVLPPWLASSYIPGTLASNKASSKRKTLAEMLVRVGQKN